jgi:hypothetical protein
MTDIIPVGERLDFFVYVIESPSPVDLYHRRSEGDMLQQAINLNQIACTLRLAVNLEAFTAAIQIGLTEGMETFPNKIPILHISAHGFTEGIQLSSGEVVYWNQLRELLIPVNQALSGSLIVCMSTCQGYSGTRMAMVPESNDHPFWAIIGNSGKPTWPETAVAFATFYHLIANGRNIASSVEAMCEASGNEKFFLETAEECKQGYIEHIKNINTAEVIEDLEQQVDDAQHGELTKLLRLSGA